MEISEKAYAKINLALEVDGIRNDGYHNLKMIMIPLELHDKLNFFFSDENNIVSDKDILDNIVLKAVELFQSTFKIKQKVKVILEKNIPIGAGLAGGSACAVAVLRGLNRLYGLNKDLKSLENLALKLGSDTLFCLYNKPAYVYGRGENMEFLDAHINEKITLFCPDISVSTKVVFENHSDIRHSDLEFENLLTLFKSKKIAEFNKLTYNDLMETTFKCYPRIKDIYCSIKSKLENVFMTGSGGTFFSSDEITHEIKDVRIIKTTAL